MKARLIMPSNEAKSGSAKLMLAKLEFDESNFLELGKVPCT